MNNKTKLKKYLVRALFSAACILIVFSVLNLIEYRVYKENFNRKIQAIVGAVLENYPDVSEYELVEILNSTSGEDNSMPGSSALSRSVFEKFGIDIEKEAVIVENTRSHRLFMTVNTVLLLFGIAAIVFVLFRYDRNRAKDIADITRTIERINKRNYELSIDTISEDELSILKHEIYKTTVMLREAADNSNADKLNLKRSLEDISHQLKTPLTSILVMLDNLIDNPDMNAEVREDFIRSIRRETFNINFFVQAILKLSRFDSNTVSFIKEETDLGSLIDNAMKNVSVLCDLRNVTLTVEGDVAARLVCDGKWQTEALTNILKNSVEHSREDGKIVIRCSQNSVYTMIEIRDFGKGIPAKDLPHVFERFYKGENTSSDSIGIGLALAKTIIEENNGTVSVCSDESGTSFRIKYFTL